MFLPIEVEVDVFESPSSRYPNRVHRGAVVLNRVDVVRLREGIVLRGRKCEVDKGAGRGRVGKILVGN